MRYFPFFFDLRGRRALVAGGGEVAQRKAELLARAGAEVVVVAPQLNGELARLALCSGGEARRKRFAVADLRGCTIAVSASGDEGLNRRVFAAARKRGVPVNVVDCPELCDFIFPAVVDRSPVVAAVSSGGASPVLARRLRARLEEQIPPRTSALAEWLGSWRDTVRDALPAERRRMFWEETLDSPAAEAILAGDEKAADELLREQLRSFAQTPARGEVYLIGAGPGDADLLTFRGHRFLQRADTVVYDRLVSAEVLDLARRDAEIVFAGKRRGLRARTQAEINELLITRARAGEKVARLKGGDPFVFGRGGEEMAALRAAGVAFRIAPGISAANGCAAAAEIPLTQRGVSAGVRLVTVRGGESRAFWRSLAEDENSTLVFYMAGAAVAAIAENLAACGRSEGTPAALICAGATASQSVAAGTLRTIAAKAAGAVFSPALLIVGAVAAFAKDARPAAAAKVKINPDFPFAQMRAAEEANAAAG